MTPGSLLSAARHYLGVSYVWGGRGDMVFDFLALRLEASPWMPELCLDCSGLVVCAIRDAGGPDWRASHNSTALRRESGATPLNTLRLRPADLLFRPGHVAIFVRQGHDAVHAFVLEAAGGHATTTSPAVAATIGARVVEHEVPLLNFTAGGRLPFIQQET